MKSRIALSVLIILLAATAFAQSEAQKLVTEPDAHNSSVALVPSEAQKSFTTLKSLAGEWEGPVTVPEAPAMSGGKMHLSLRVTSRGNVLVHEFQEAGTPLDATKYDHPVTMFYLDNDRLLLTHYCDAGNRPRMAARTSADGKTVEFDFVDIAGSTQYGHMEHAVFTIIDDNHHSEDWTYLMPGDKPMHAHMDLQRAK